MVDHKEAVTQHTASRYVLGELSPAEREDFEEHYFGCMECAEDVRALMTFSSNAVLASWERPDRRSIGSFFRNLLEWRPPAIYAAAPACALLVLTAVAAYQSNSLRKQLAPQAVAEFALHPETRGEETVISIAQRGPLILLSAEPPGTAPEWKWQIRRVDSQTALMEGTVPAPRPGFPLTLLVPSSKFKGGQYVLTLRAGDSPFLSRAPALYRFRMQ